MLNRDVNKHANMSKSLFINVFVAFILYSCGTNRNGLIPINTVHSVFADSDGLIVGNNIYLNGKLIGKVQDLSLNSEAQILVKMKIDSICSISQNSFVEIASDFLGIKSLEITSKPCENYISNMDTLRSRIKEGYPSIQLEPDTNLDSLFQELLDTTNR